MPQLKILKTTIEQIISDLNRPHDFAFERVGFLYVKIGYENSLISQVLATNYYPVADCNYIKDEQVGTKINSSAIREVMQRILDTGEGVLHVHKHHHFGKPRFSKVDIHSLPGLVKSFQTVGPDVPHGALLLSKNEMTSLLWIPKKKEPIFVEKITIVGYPMDILRR